MRLGVFTVLLWALQFVSADRKLSADALVTCDDSTSITSKEFSILYDHKTHTIYYNASVNVAIEGYVFADIDVYIYGLKAITARLNPCESGSALKQLCPLTSGKIEIESNSVLGDSIASKIPGVAFTVPDIDAFAVFTVKNYTTGDSMACLYVEIQNTKSVEQTAVKWVTAVLSGLGLLVSALMVFLGTSIDSQNISAVTVMMLSYFQSMVFLDMEAVQRVPPIANAWCNNIAWSVGIVYATFLEKIYRWYVQATGGTPTTYHLDTINRVLVQKLKKRGAELLDRVSPRSLEYLNTLSLEWLTPEGQHSSSRAVEHQLSKRISAPRKFPVTLDSSTYVTVYRGIERMAYKSGLEVTSVVMVTYTIFIFVCVCAVFLYACLWLFMNVFTRNRRRAEESVAVTEKEPFPDSPEDSVNGFSSQNEPNTATAHPDNISATFTSLEKSHYSRATFLYYLIPALVKGTLLKLWLVALPAIVVFSMWEWTHVDSAAVVVVSVFMLAVCLTLALVNMVKVFLIARDSSRQTGSPTYLLYSNPKTLQKYGYLYSMFQGKYYWFGAVFVAYNIVKAAFVAFSQKSGKTQSLAIFIIEVAMLTVVSVLKPFLSRAVNGIQIATHVIMMLNACCFLFFSSLMTQNLIVTGVLGVVFFILNAAYSLVLLLYIIIYSCLCAHWHRKGTTKRAHIARDDRDSFIVDSQGRAPEVADEFHALGHAAEADHQGLTQTQDAEWFNHDHTTNPFDQQRPSGENSSGYNTAGRLNTMDSEYSSNHRVFNDIGTSNGHHVRESQASFGLDSEKPENTPNTKQKKRFSNFFR